MGLLLAGTPAAHAQITVEEPDVRDFFEQGPYALISLEAEDADQADDIQAVLDAVGAGGVYDFSDVAFAVIEEVPLVEGRVDARPFDSEVPDSSVLADAEFATVFDFSSEEGGRTIEGTIYNYTGIGTNSGAGDFGVYGYGNISTIDPPIPGFPAQVAQLDTTFTPLPLTFGTGPWTASESASLLGATTVRRSEIVGYGTLIMADKAPVPCLVERTYAIDQRPGMPDDTTGQTLLFFTGDRRLNLDASLDADGNLLVLPDDDSTPRPQLSLTLQSEDAEVVTIGGGSALRLAEAPPYEAPAASVLGGIGSDVTFTTPSTTAGTLRGYYVDYPLPNNEIDDPDNLMITKVSPEGFWTITAEDLSGFAYTICLDYSETGGITDPSALAVLKRETSTEPWTALESTTDTGAEEVCASGLTSFSYFAIGSTDANALPVELASFEAVLHGGGAVELSWETLSETQNAGFEVQRALVDDPGGARPWIALDFVEGAGTTSTPQRYTFTDAEVPFGAARLAYRLRQVDADGRFAYSPEVEVNLGVPARLVLHRAFPNPTAGGVTLRYALPRAADVRLALYDVLGRRVAWLALGEQSAGQHTARFDAGRLTPGLYVWRLEAGGANATQRMVVVR